LIGSSSIGVGVIAGVGTAGAGVGAAGAGVGVSRAGVGAGTAVGVTAFEATDADPDPATLAAVTVKVYDLPGVRPVTVQARAPDVEHVRLSGLDVTM
jgi:hypothetical protein